ncbi:MAG: hypothetical protein P4L98_23140, partial [Ancalomicrobiaceae bacterium]|nr:hypothetical protein [Ancalomicrobiaceae bacterium]
MDAQSDLAHRDTFAGMSDRDGGVFLHLHRDQNDPLCGSVDLCGLPVEVLSRLRLSNPAPEDWPAWFSVFVGAAIEADEAALPAVLGRYSVVEDCVRFTPKYAWMRGTSYQIRINLAPLVVGTRPQPIRWLSFSVPGDAAAAATIVSGVFPSGDCLPENTLRFYIHFSAAMRSGSSQAHVSLVGPDGRSIEGAFLHL